MGLYSQKIWEYNGKLFTKSYAAAEVKFSQTVSFHDFKAITEFAAQRDNFERGYVFCLGDKVLPFGENLFALPVKVLF